jgi:trimeric autotransporter adhesin
MKKIIMLLIFIATQKIIVAQNVGIGTAEPMNKLQVQGSLLVTTPTVATSTAPTVAQTKTMVNASTITFLNTDSIGRIYDPGGPSGNYLANMIANASFDGFGTSIIGIEITAETMGLGTGDSIIIKETSSSNNILLAVGNGYTATGKWVFNSTQLYITFKSNADPTTGIGFSLLFKALYNNSSSLPDISGATGHSLFFDSKNGSFRSGLLNNNVKGIYSTAMGQSTTASGFTSTAMGFQTTASGDYSIALGLQTIASGDYSTTMGFGTTASGDFSIVMGENTNASGNASTAMGAVTTASGNYSTAMGFNSEAGGSYSTAMGLFTTASGDASTSMGNGTTASAFASTAMGANTTASGLRSTAIGGNTNASGERSTAMGNYVSTNNQNGSFVIGDNSTTTVMSAANANNFRARFAGGYRLFTSANLSTGCTLFAGDNAWTTGSDVRTKENFAAINGEDFLKKISGFDLTSWNYKKQDPTIFRHYGPMAQDFYAAFGKDEYGTIGNDTTINSADFAGVSFVAIQALEKRTQKIELLEKENAELKAMLLQLRKEMDELKK